MNLFDNKNINIIIYSDSDILSDYEKLIKLELELENFNIIKILLINEEKKNKYDLNNTIEIYTDIFFEYDLIKKTDIVIYLSKYKKSNILIDCIQEFNKLILYDSHEIKNNILYYLSNKEDNTFINNSINNFIEYYNILNINNEINSKNENKNIKINIIKKNLDIENKICLVTYYKKTDDNLINILQQKCILENLNNKNIGNILVIYKNISNEFEDIIEVSKKNKTNNKLMLYDLEYIDNIETINYNYSNIIKIINELYSNHIVCLIRSDLIVPFQSNINMMELDIELENKIIYAIPRLERLINGKIIQNDKLQRLLFSTEHDAWIFKSPLKINDITILDKLNFFDKYSNLYFNKILKDNNYTLINQTNYIKIIRLMIDNNIYLRPIINENLNNEIKDNIYLLPSIELINNTSFEQLIKLCELNEKDIYELKCDIFNKFLKNKIISNI
jgi:hypothetical protein